MSNRKRLKRPRKPKREARPAFRFGAPIATAFQGWARMASSTNGSSGGLLSTSLSQPGKWRTAPEEKP